MLLRPLQPSDAAAMLELRLANREHFTSGEPLHDESWFTLSAQRQALEALAAERRAGTREMFGIVVGDRIVGYVSLSQIFRGAFQNCFLGYAVDREHSGRGIATAAVAEAVEHAWSIGLHRVQANVIPENVASRRVLEKNRFRHEGRALRYLHIGGRWADHDMFAKTVEER